MTAEDLLREALEINKENDLGILGMQFDVWAVKVRELLDSSGVRTGPTPHPLNEPVKWEMG